jgi:hypothetical protein
MNPYMNPYEQAISFSKEQSCECIIWCKHCIFKTYCEDQCSGNITKEEFQKLSNQLATKIIYEQRENKLKRILK